MLGIKTIFKITPLTLRLPKFLTWQLQLNLSKTFFNFCLRKNEKGKEVKSDCARAFIMFHLLD